MTVANNAAPATTDQQGAIAKKEVSHAERFTNAVVREFSANSGGDINLTPFQRKLCQNYFIRIDLQLKELEQKRLAKSEKYRDPLAYSWENVNMMKLANDVIIFSGIGLDPTQPNHINPIPYKNSKTNKFDFTFIIGYRGTELKAKRYGLDIPDDVVVELVYSKDKFKAIKKDMNNAVETYLFEMSEDFDRGEIVGGFFYYKYFNAPERNKIKTFSKKDIDKRRPDNASAEFWSGKKDKWEYDEASGRNKKVGTEEVEGWYDEMAYKTIYKAAYNGITIDSQKIDANYLSYIVKESESRDAKIANEITDKANKKEIGFDGVQEAEQVSGVVSETVNQDELKDEPEPESSSAQTTISGPGF